MFWASILVVSNDVFNEEGLFSFGNFVPFGIKESEIRFGLVVGNEGNEAVPREKYFRAGFKLA